MSESTTAAVRIVQITSFKTTVGGDTVQWRGIESFDFSFSKGEIKPVTNEGDLYPTGFANTGTTEFPVTTNTKFASMLVGPSLLALDVHTLVVVGKSDAGNYPVQITIDNHQFGSKGDTHLVKQGEANQGLPGLAHSADGVTLPLTISYLD